MTIAPCGAHSQKKGHYQSYLSTTDTRSETDKTFLAYHLSVFKNRYFDFKLRQIKVIKCALAC